MFRCFATTQLNLHVGPVTLRLAYLGVLARGVPGYIQSPRLELPVIGWHSKIRQRIRLTAACVGLNSVVPLVLLIFEAWQPQNTTGICGSRVATEFPYHCLLKCFSFTNSHVIHLPDHLILVRRSADNKTRFWDKPAVSDLGQCVFAILVKIHIHVPDFSYISF